MPGSGLESAGGYFSFGNPFEPVLFPIEEAPRLAAAVGAAITTSFEMDCMVNPAAADGKDGIASLMRSFVDLKPLAAERGHFGHEWHTLETSVAIKGAEDFVLAANFHPVTNSKFR